jgi:hypothetical protein
MIVNARCLVTVLGLVLMLGGCAGTKARVEAGALTPRSTENGVQSSRTNRIHPGFRAQEPTKQGGDGSLERLSPIIILAAVFWLAFHVAKD